VGLGVSCDEKDAEEDGSGGDSEDEDGAAEGLAHPWGGAGGSVAAEAASLGVAGQGKSEGEGKDRAAEPDWHCSNFRAAGVL
jgi:hypothetical protein